ncbi:type II toxin-antitoxin system HipA family toxin, partial [bacterium]
MKLKSGTPLRVTLDLQGKKVDVGRLALDRGAAVLEYAPDFIASGLKINPAFSAPDRTLVQARDPRAFGGLHGVFADSLPDAWGELLLRRRAEAAGISYVSLTALDKLAAVG